MEKLFYDYGVDLALWAHEHSYERLWPVYNLKVYNGSANEPYNNPKAPVHVITGSAVSTVLQTKLNEFDRHTSESLCTSVLWSTLCFGIINR